MAETQYTFHVAAGEARVANGLAHSLADDLREVPGVLASDRRKDTDATMDLGSVVAVIATSGATLAIAKGIADWLRRRKSATLTIERISESGSIKAAVGAIDSDAAVRIVEIIRGM